MEDEFAPSQEWQRIQSPDWWMSDDMLGAPLLLHWSKSPAGTVFSLAAPVAGVPKLHLMESAKKSLHMGA